MRTAFINGHLLTMAEDQPTAEALLVDDGDIVAVGSSADVPAQVSDDTEVVDLGGKTLLPGFIDPTFALHEPRSVCRLGGCVW